tara:strand:+ start:110 stop:274 length:165 start_codon:yes stop_codon:yes gene_type:complete
MEDSILEKDHSQKMMFFTMGFMSVFLLIFAFQFVSQKVGGVRDNYLTLFCTNIK